MIFKSQNGFSLVEVLVVIGILSIMVGIGMTQLHRYVQNNNLKAATREIQGDFFEAKERSISENRMHRVVFDVANNTYEIQRCANASETPCSNYIAVPIKTRFLSDFGSGSRLAQSIVQPCYVGAGTSFNVTDVQFGLRGTMIPTTGTMLLVNNRNSTATMVYNLTGKIHACFRMQ